MKIAVVGTGKTGSEVVKQLRDEELVGPFNTTHPLTVNALQDADAAVLFVPGEAAIGLIPVLLESKIPAVWGTTGIAWPHGLHTELKKGKISWVHGENFSLGMAFVKQLLLTCQKWRSLLDKPIYSLHDLHHAAKKDAPSGTAFAWQRWLQQEQILVTSIREGDHPGTHTLKIATPHETITIEHASHSRSQYASGALFAAAKLVSKEIEPGLHSFESLLEMSAP